MQAVEMSASQPLSVDLVRAARRSEELQSVPEREVVRDYERFLLLARIHPDETLAPTKAIDRIWHLHMQHPRAYVADCTRLFGDILDHDGGFGGTPDEEPVLLATFQRTSMLWEQAFGEPYVGAAGSIVKCTRNCVSRCQRACKTTRPTAGR